MFCRVANRTNSALVWPICFTELRELLALAGARNGVDALVDDGATDVEAVLHSLLADVLRGGRTRGTRRLGVGAIATSGDGQPQSQQQPENDFRVPHSSPPLRPSQGFRIKYSWRQRRESSVLEWLYPTTTTRPRLALRHGPPPGATVSRFLLIVLSSRHASSRRLAESNRIHRRQITLRNAEHG